MALFATLTLYLEVGTVNLIQVAKELGTDEQCLDYLEKQRWPEGVRCALCGSANISRITRKTESKNKRNRIYQCLEESCGQQFSATAGTIFHDSHLPLTKWFMALALITNAKKGISAKQVQRDLKVGYQTAWYLCHRIRKAMEEKDGGLLTGTVEIDETYVGGKARRKQIRKEGKYKVKDCVVGMVERGGKLRLRHLGKGSATSEAVGAIIEANVSSDVERVITDESVIYPFGLPKEFLPKHETIMHAREYERGDVYTNTNESAFSLLKRGIVGQFHKVSIRHLPRYLAEFEYRFNRRDEQENMFGETVRRMVKTDKMPFRQLVLEAKRGRPNYEAQK